MHINSVVTATSQQTTDRGTVNNLKLRRAQERMLSLKPLLLVCLVAVGGARTQEVDISVSIGSNKLDIDIESFKDPCDDHQCSIGERCESVFTPQLTKLPVAHCLQVKQDKEGSCVEYSVNTNLFTCKTATEWERIGSNQCTLRGDQSRNKLSSTEVQFKCHSMTLERKYLRATFTCCLPPTTETQSETSPPKYQESDPQASPSVGNVVSPSEDTQTGKWSITNHLVPVLLGVVAVLTIVALLLIVWHRNKGHRRAGKPKMMIATSFVNPNADHHDTNSDWVFNPLDSTDKSLLIINETPRE